MKFKTGAGNKPELYDEQTGRYTATSPEFKEAKKVEGSLKDTGLAGYTSSIMPGYEKAYTDPSKFYRYSLNPSHPIGKHKAKAYQNKLGYNLTNAESLIKQIDDAIHSGKAKLDRLVLDDYGIAFRFTVPVTGPNGQTRPVRATYQIDFKGDLPHMTTNYVK